jgi:nitric oxide reductase activation protein
MGQRFNARDVVHNDGKYFSRISVPDGKLRVCFGILVDESGSMYGRKTESARRATILLEDTLRNLNVPFMICGHTTGWSDEVLIRSFVDFDTNDGKDRYRLADITAMYGNTDGGAITYVGEKLLKRPEEQKVLIVISDGQPSGTSFYSYDYNEDTTMAVNYYRKKRYQRIRCCGR